MDSERKKEKISHVIIRYFDAISDPLLGRMNNRGRKALVKKIYNEKEHPLRKGLDPAFPDFVIWKPDDNGEVPIFEVGEGGTEVTLFNEKTKQDRHKHLLATEIYTILEGKMKIRIDDKEIELNQHDEAVILPGTVQEIPANQKKFLTRGRTINCHGQDDKYIEVNGKWISSKKINNF